MKYSAIFFLISCLLLQCKAKEATEPNYNINQSQHFQVALYDGLPSSVASDVLEQLENNYQRIIDDLGIASLPVVSVEIWADNSNFQSAMEKNIGRRYPGSTGYVKFTGICLLNTGNVSRTAVHEFAHVVTLHVNNRIGNNPRWLWEAVALYETGELIDPKQLPYMVSGDYPTLAELDVDYNSSDHKIYQVGYTLVEFILHDWNRDALIQLIKNNGNTQTGFALTTEQFADRWYQFVKAKYL